MSAADNKRGLEASPRSLADLSLLQLLHRRITLKRIRYLTRKGTRIANKLTTLWRVFADDVRVTPAGQGSELLDAEDTLTYAYDLNRCAFMAVHDINQEEGNPLAAVLDTIQTRIGEAIGLVRKAREARP